MDIKLSDHFSCGRLIRFSLPNIGILTVNYAYELTDGFFIANYIGTAQFAAVTLIAPLLLSTLAIAAMFGFGGSALIARTLGEGHQQRANEYLSLLVFSLAAIGLILSALFIGFMPELARLLGATDDLLGYCTEYGRIVSLGLPFHLLGVAFQSYYTAAEKPHFGFYTSVAAGITNAIFDYLLIVHFHLGIAGAAIATVGSTLNGLIPVYYFARQNSGRLRFASFRFELPPVINACHNGLAECITNLSLSLVIILFNYRLIELFGELGVAAMGIIGFADTVVFSIYNGYTMTVVPIVAYHYGATNFAEVQSLLKKSLSLTFGCGIVLGLLAFFGAEWFAGIFASHDHALLQLTTHALSLIALSFALSGIGTFAAEFFAGLNDGSTAGIIAFSRLFLFQLAGLFIIPRIFGADGIWYVMSVSELLSLAVVAICLQVKRYEYTGEKLPDA